MYVRLRLCQHCISPGYNANILQQHSPSCHEDFNLLVDEVGHSVVADTGPWLPTQMYTIYFPRHRRTYAGLQSCQPFDIILPKTPTDSPLTDRSSNHGRSLLISSPFITWLTPSSNRGSLEGHKIPNCRRS